MENSIHTFKNEDEIIKVQMIEFDDFNSLHFFNMKKDHQAFINLCNLYQNYIVKKYKEIFGTLILFTLPDDYPLNLDNNTEYGTIYSKETLLNIYFRKHICLKNGELVFNNERSEEIFNDLVNKDCLKIAKGKRKYLKFLPVSNKLGFISESHKDSMLRFNSNFFVMDSFDVDSVYDVIGTNIGLCIDDGKIINPSFFDRETFIYKKDGTFLIEKTNINDLEIIIDNKVFNKDNCHICMRPDCLFTKESVMDLIIVENEVVSIKRGGKTRIPSGGFVISLDKEIEINDRKVSYQGYNDIKFAVQVGNSILIDNKETLEFKSSFYNFLKFWKVSFPPSMYPLNFKKSKAPRMILGTKDNKGVVLWIEGKGKFGYQNGLDSAGASLLETVKICKSLGLNNAIHLDGGGSAEIYYQNRKLLKVSDRDEKTLEEIERGLSLGLFI
ncbi:MAG: phosphodiester glycosidase family protein [Erysipelotrichaceae bacterium]|nr:phosphodiester glycosidase family protein [Erysipelotrichaceae bacterium]